jgi:hypothetical protein
MTGTLLALAICAQAPAPPQNLDQRELAKLFVGNARVSFEGDTMIVESNGIPNHPTAKYPNADNPNSIFEQRLKFYIPLHPVKSARFTNTPFGPIGVAINGIPFFNQYNREGGDAVRMEVFDSCCGHPDPRGLYHYHKYPVCIKSPFHDPDGKHSPIIGFMFDGYAVYGPNGEDGKPPKDLDSLNGHTDAKRGYHYHVTEGYPYIVGGYRGTVDMRNLRRPGF